MKRAEQSERFVTALTIAGMCLGFANAATAAEQQEQQRLCPICMKANNQRASYGENAANTLARGALNLGLGWTELIRQPGKNARKGKNVLLGFANGVGFSARRTLRGLGEVLTFWAPKMQGEYIHFSKDCPLDTMQ